MNPFQSEATCEVCGEDSICDAETAAAAWNPGCVVKHADPSMCSNNIRHNTKKMLENMNRYKIGDTVQYKGETAIISNVSQSRGPKIELILEILRLSGEVKKVKLSELDRS